MNLILISPHEYAPGAPCTLSDSRASHLLTYLHATPGATFRLGILNGPQGTGTILSTSPTSVTFSIHCTSPTLPPWYDLLLALPRPRSLKRILFQSAAMGVRNILITGAEKVEKSYFSMHLLRPEEYTPVLIDGLMQGATTTLPTLTIIPRFRDLWTHLPSDNTLRIIANPSPTLTPLPPPPPGTPHRPLIAIGPDGGWTPQENAAFAQNAFLPFTLGPRPLRTDTAAIALPAVIQDRLSRA